MKATNKNRWLVLVAALAMQTCVGGIYAWSTYAPALAEEHGVSAGVSGTVFGICIAVFSLAMIAGGVLIRHWGPGMTAGLGGCLFGGGHLLGAISGGHPALILAGFGIVAGMGIGLVYACPIAVGIQWFPRHKGLVTGAMVAGFGLGGMFAAEAGQHLLALSVPVLRVLGIIGGGSGLIVLGAACFLSMPTSPDAADHTETLQPTADAVGKTHTRTRELLPKDSRFWMLPTMLFCGTFGGLLVVGNLAPLGIANGLLPQHAGLAVVLFAIGNAAGRLLWGHLHDQHGARSISACLWTLTLFAFVLGQSHTAIGFILSAVGVAVAFGGLFVVFAADVARVFGPQRVASLYPLVFLGYGVAGLIAPAMGGYVLQQTGSTTKAASLAVAAALAGSLLSRQYQVSKCSRLEQKTSRDAAAEQ